MKHKKLTKKVSVTIGIPAYNEEMNINFLLKELLSQTQTNFILDKIIVCSDGSTDDTVSEINKMKSSKIQPISNRSRRGQAYSQNKILSNTKSDILVLLNADILLVDSLLIEKLIRPIIFKGADLTSARVVELQPKNLFERMLKNSMEIKREIFESVRDGNNIYTCHGRVRSFSKRFYKKFSFKEEITAEDAYSYLYCIYNKYIYEYSKNAKIYYKLPANLADHKRQSLRFFNSQKQLGKEFGTGFVYSQYHLPVFSVIKSFVSNFFKKPILVSLYLILLCFMKLNSLIPTYSTNKWEIATSSKVLKK